MNEPKRFRVLELFSGIGGMHYAIQEAGANASIVYACDINVIANSVYRHNFPDVNIVTGNIQALTAKTVKKVNANMILMSPPCQPHTRKGNRLDVNDKRSDGLQHIIDLLPELESIEYILLENVKGFEVSKAHDRYIDGLQKCGFHAAEFILTPSQFGVPNTRYRYYCLARKHEAFPFKSDVILETLPNGKMLSVGFEPLKEILEPDSAVDSNVYVPDKILSKRVGVMDIATTESTNTMCFTKAYTHYVEGSGSVFSPLSKQEVKEIFEMFDEIKSSDDGTMDQLKLLGRLKLRYFTPREVARLMSFADEFTFPEDVTNKQKYRLLGNSINIKVVSELIKTLCA